MGDKARAYTQLTLKRLFALSGNNCAFPNCSVILTNSNNGTNFSNICHIADASPGNRYDANMTDKERADFDNLILLCPNHHIETNDPKYTVSGLKKMKQDHESNFLYERLAANPSMLKNTINAIAAISLECLKESESLNSIKPKEKIKFNELKRNISIINEYKVFSGKINKLYDELELQGSIKKEKLLASINSIYLRVKGGYILDSSSPLSIIQQNSDNIFDDVYNELYSKMEESSLFDENIVLGIRLIMVDAFIRCKILEEPT